MKLIKKIAAIMFAFMMVVSMSCNVKADEGTTPATETGTITIDNAIEGQAYTIFKVLDLESYVPKEEATPDGLYSYKPVAEWETFLKTGEGNKYITVDENGYARWRDDVTDAKAAEFAQIAIAHAKSDTSIKAITNEPSTTKNNDGTLTLTYSGLSLGYYLVGSSTGALCGLNTTNPNAEIEEKNGVPSVEKKIVENNVDKDSNFANIGETVHFKTTITAQKGAQSYVLHDTMTEGLTFNNDINVKISNQANNLDSTNDYEVITNSSDKCTFEIKFTDTFLKTVNNETKIEVTYSAVLNGKAKINQYNDNTTYLTYGENKETTESVTHTFTSQISVLKYTKNINNPLAGAKFSLYDAETNGNIYKLVQKTDTENYRLLTQNESGVTEVTEITTTNTGKISIQGLKPGTYWLEETAAPKGYNKLAKRIKVEIKDDGTLVVDGKDKNDKGHPISQVNVENKTGTVLPSTGGAGTTMIYLIGGALVLGSGVVLATKRRVKDK